MFFNYIIKSILYIINLINFNQIKNNFNNYIIFSVEVDNKDITDKFIELFSFNYQKNKIRIRDFIKNKQFNKLVINYIYNEDLKEISYTNKHKYITFHNGLNWSKYDNFEKNNVLKSLNYLDLSI